MRKKPKKITERVLRSSPRLVSIERQMHNYLNHGEISKKKLRKGFRGVASERTVSEIVEASPFFESRGDLVRSAGANHKATVTYDFESDASGLGVIVGGVKGASGKGKKLKNVPLKGIGYRLSIKVGGSGVGNWTFTIKKIEVTDSGNKHLREMDESPIKGSGTDTKEYDTDKIF